MRKKKWPKKWEDVLMEAYRGLAVGDNIPKTLLAAIDKAGALKDPPKPREYWVVNIDGSLVTTRFEYEAEKLSNNKDEIIHVREVLEEEDDN